ncbi:Aflatoxin biosynthesis regulatory protein [Penicillium vulpinum]|uniref:Aflatoxin biosynthesis regulatory protein n=1 Tax=Penicillium vulpinum TaxID=29845 RepID=UPI00254979C1|nr:Aflatoxin biosynthesis regulatory protein [Penicillium vulpinum]KAJ5959945.1 Aflatoxin biosynthesis regulatory protein [Penicillium vulpinum]
MDDVQPKAKTRPHSSRHVPGQNMAFRIPNYKKDPLAYESEPSEHVYHSRRSHRKSRAGCVNCKQRRVKCNEAKPHCLRCQKHGVECDYSSQLARPQMTNKIVSKFIKTSPELVSIDSLASSISLMMVADKLKELLQLPSDTGTKLPRALTDASASARTLEALHHFHKAPAFATECQTPIRIVMGKVVELAFESPFLMHAIIAAATTHLCTLLPDNKAYRLAEAYHWQQTINQYSTEVSTNITRANMDKLYSTCLMISMHSFIQETFNPRASFVFSTDPTALTWLRLQIGLRYLIECTLPWLPQSMWWTVFMTSRDPSLDFEDTRPGRVGLDPDLANLCGIRDDSTVEENPCLWPLRMLMQLLPFERKADSFRVYNTWMGRLENPFYECLLRKETPALVVLAWWLGLMCYVEEWWVEMRVRSECTAICMFLEDSSDPLVLKLLEFPASCCGYLLRHEQEGARFLELD